MPVLFKRQHAWQIKEGRKTVQFSATRPKNTKIGREYAVQIKPERRGDKPAAPLCRVVLRSCHTIQLGEVDDAEARRAGYMDLASFKCRWIERGLEWDPKRTIWRSEFALRGPALTARVAA